MTTQPKQSLPVISMGKFTVLYFVTQNFYALYWFYRCWVAFREDSAKPIYPIFRALFAVFYVHELFSYIQKKEGHDTAYPWDPSKAAWQFIAIGAVGVSLMFANEYLQLGPIVRLLIFLVLLFAQYYVLYRVQLVINRVAGDPFGRSNSKMSLENNLWIAFGLYLWVGTIYNSYLEITGQAPVRPPIESQIKNKDISTT